MKKPTPFGKYYLLERINVGGMAEVFRAKAFGVEGFERLVAVKRILPHIAEDQEFIRMFIEEAKLAVQLGHANIAQIFDLGVVEGSFYIALEHVHGRDVRAIFDRYQKLGETMSVAQSCFIAMKVCEGLDYAHNKRDQSGRELALVHRDVSPQNVLVSFEGEVKLIDFGVAKAAGGDGTRADIRKGKFGYMSPEQVRGDEIDRRSDVFSCGIVLYELLTGERLFTGDSEFAMLEKVRNVEILPPSTYNRRIPDELERIVLKALARDADERYQSAIDLHDELQAFVYTAGEFYSRKDLAAWMKKAFAKEIEDETAKLESYRQLRPLALGAAPEDAVPEPVRDRPSGPAVSGAVGKPGRTGSQPIAVAKAPSRPSPVAGSPRARSQPVAIVPPPLAPPASLLPSVPIAVAQPIELPRDGAPAIELPRAVPPAGQRPRSRRGGDWDDDELETRVYDGDDARHRSNRTTVSLHPPSSSTPGLPLPLPPSLAPPSLAPPAERQEADAGAARDGAGWTPGSTEQFSHVEPSLGSEGDRDGVAAPDLFAAAPTEIGPPDLGPPDLRPTDLTPPPLPEPPSTIVERPARPPHLAGSGVDGAVAPSPAAEAPHVAARAFGARIVAGRRSRDAVRNVQIAIASIAVVIALSILGMELSGRTRTAPAAPQPPVAAKPPSGTVTTDPNTGFDLYVAPPGITQWKLDGELRNDRLPSRIRGIAPGPHTVQIEPLPGFLSQSQQVSVELGKAPRIDIALQPISGISGVFESTPPGVSVSLIVDGKRRSLGVSPARAPLDPRSAYQVVFEKPGYVSINRPVVFTGVLEEHVTVRLEKVGSDKAGSDKAGPEKAGLANVAPPSAPALAAPPSGAVSAMPASRAGDVRPHGALANGLLAGEPAPAGPRSAPGDLTSDAGLDRKAQGTLVLGSNPPCDIAIDGSATGLHTPQAELRLLVGRHRVTLTNRELGINDTFTVDIKPDAPEKLVKDYADRRPH